MKRYFNITSFIRIKIFHVYIYICSNLDPIQQVHLISDFLFFTLSYLDTSLQSKSWPSTQPFALPKPDDGCPNGFHDNGEAHVKTKYVYKQPNAQGIGVEYLDHVRKMGIPSILMHLLL